MPKSKLASSMEAQDQNALQLDPLIDALLEHLPPPGDAFPKELRTLWLQILELSLKLIYTEDETEPEPSNP